MTFKNFKISSRLIRQITAIEKIMYLKTLRIPHKYNTPETPCTTAETLHIKKKRIMQYNGARVIIGICNLHLTFRNARNNTKIFKTSEIYATLLGNPITDVKNNKQVDIINIIQTKSFLLILIYHFLSVSP